MKNNSPIIGFKYCSENHLFQNSETNINRETNKHKKKKYK